MGDRVNLDRLSIQHVRVWQETSAMGKLSDAELEMVYKTGIQPTVYLANNSGWCRGRAGADLGPSGGSRGTVLGE